MAHFALLDKDNVVTQIIVVDNAELGTPESEERGAAFCNSLIPGRWVQTSYNANFRKNYAGIGYRYDAVLDAFVPPQPYPSWVLDAQAQWQPPVPYPTDGRIYEWDDVATSWVAVEA